MSASPAVVYRIRGADALLGVRAFVERLVSEEYDALVADVVRNEAAALARHFDPAHDALLTAERGDHLVGVLLVTPEPLDPAAARFDWLIVDGPERNGGVGRELLSRGIEACRERHRVVLRARSFAASPAGPHLYWLFGFRVVDLVPVTVGDGTRESILFEKRLSLPALSPES